LIKYKAFAETFCRFDWILGSFYSIYVYSKPQFSTPYLPQTFPAHSTPEPTITAYTPIHIPIELKRENHTLKLLLENNNVDYKKSVDFKQDTVITEHTPEN